MWCVAVLPDINLSSSLTGGGGRGREAGQGGPLSTLLAASLGRVTLASLGLGRELNADQADQLPPVSADSRGKLVQMGSGNNSPDATAVAARNSRRGSETSGISLTIQPAPGLPR